ncbi:MAG: hypothetical protein KJ749_15065 [Planctomycetes bacterium]|nr:hypothetical protein [Planctomycetota bacterium]
MPSRRLKWLTLSILPMIAACNLLTPLVFISEQRQKVPAEFDKLGDRQTAVLVWTDAATLFDYPYARLELAAYVGGKLAAELAQRRLDATIVDARDVDDYLQENLTAVTDPQAVGERFETDYVIFLQILEFQIRDPREPQFLRGRITASVTVYDVKADADQPREFELAPVTCEYPEGPPLLLSANNAPAVREMLYRKFAEQVARKFYEHTIELGP